MPKTPGYKGGKTGFSSPLGVNFNEIRTSAADEKFEESWNEFAQGAMAIEDEDNDQDRKRRRKETFKSNKKIYCCCGEDKEGGRCAEAQLILKSYFCSIDYASGTIIFFNIILNVIIMVNK